MNYGAWFKPAKLRRYTGDSLTAQRRKCSVIKGNMSALSLSFLAWFGWVHQATLGLGRTKDTCILGCYQGAHPTGGRTVIDGKERGCGVDRLEQ